MTSRSTPLFGFSVIACSKSVAVILLPGFPVCSERNEMGLMTRFLYPLAFVAIASRSSGCRSGSPPPVMVTSSCSVASASLSSARFSTGVLPMWYVCGNGGLLVVQMTQSFVHSFPDNMRYRCRIGYHVRFRAVLAPSLLPVSSISRTAFAAFLRVRFTGVVSEKTFICVSICYYYKIIIYI